jgi:hypothetical protein
MNEFAQSDYSDEDKAKIEENATATHEVIKGIANAWIGAWIGDEGAASSDQVVSRIDPEQLQNAAGFILAACTCVDRSLVKGLTEIIGAIVAFKTKVDYKRPEPKAPRSGGNNGG